MSQAPRPLDVLLLDSGIGGLTIARAIRRRCPHVGLHYIADNGGFPYGGRSAEALTDRVCALVERALMTLSVDAVVIACNTASTVCLPALRSRLALPVVGVVPAIRPAAALTRSGVIGLLATPGTVASGHVASLIAQFAGHCRVLKVGAPKLAALAEQCWRQGGIDAAMLADELAPLREPQWLGLDTLVLGCTHYPLLRAELEAQLGPQVQLVDSAQAVARRLETVLEAQAGITRPAVSGRFYFTRDQDDNAALAALIKSEGFSAMALWPELAGGP